MLAWIFNRFRRAAWERSRAIFRYWDGRRTRAVDPMAAWQSLLDDPEYVMERHNVGVDRGDPEAIAVVSRTVGRVFGVPDFDRGGLSRTERVNLLADFFDFLDAQKKSTSDSPTSSDSMDQESSPLEPSTITMSSSGFGGTPIGSI